MSNSLDIGREVINKHKGKVISASSIAGIITVLAWLGINPLDFIVENSSAYKVIDSEVETLQAEVHHFDHIIKTQNFMLRMLVDSHMISLDEYDSSRHDVSH